MGGLLFVYCAGACFALFRGVKVDVTALRPVEGGLAPIQWVQNRFPQVKLALQNPAVK